MRDQQLLLYNLYGEVQRLSMVKYMVRDKAIPKCEGPTLGEWD